jgi:phosphate transport system protein
MDELRRGFHAQLDEVRAELARLAAMVIEGISRATLVLLDGDLEAANRLIEGDDEVDSRSIDLEERCYQLLALQAPVAGDLRQLVAIVKMVGEIERSADLTVNIAKASRRIYGHELDPKVRGLIARMGEQAHQLFTSALESFEESDAAKAAAIDDMDSFLDGLQRELVRRILETHADSEIDLQVAIQLAMVARFYERIGDHAVNIGERVRYLVDGWLPEHSGAARFKKRRDDTGELNLPPAT